MENAPREQVTTFDHDVTPVEGADRIELEQELGSQLQPEYTTFDNLSFSHGDRQELQQEIADNMQQQEIAQQQEQQAPAPAPASHDV